MNGVSEEYQQRVRAELDAIESEHGVRVLYACESGSRAWGFASPDSDYDARFVYVHPRDWYLSIEPGRDVIELPIDDELDVSGWDLRKALGLLRAGNATAIEWLDSPVVYREADGFADAMRALCASSFRRDRSFHHYLALSQKHLDEALRGDDVRLKKFLYSLRATLAAAWSLDRDDPPPMTLAALADAGAPGATVRGLINDLVDAKAGLDESARYRVPQALVDFVRAEQERLDAADVPKTPPGPVEPFDAAFRAWAG